LEVSMSARVFPLTPAELLALAVELEETIERARNASAAALELAQRISTVAAASPWPLRGNTWLWIQRTAEGIADVLPGGPPGSEVDFVDPALEG
jgi:hypothetical protein